MLANALRFSTRLDISDTSPLVTDDSYSLSTVLLALVLLNGEILWNSNEIPNMILGHDLLSYLEHCEYLFNPPHHRTEQYFIDHCRFKTPTITRQGMKTQGWVFKLFSGQNSSHSADRPGLFFLTRSEKKALSELCKHDSSQARKPGSVLSEAEQEVVELIISKLEKKWPGCSLAELMQRSLKLDRSPPRPGEQKAATLVFLKMMAAVVRALREGHEIRLAQSHAQPNDSPPSALFISPDLGWVTEDKDDAALPVYVFTSWDNPRNSHRQERLASLEVAVTEKAGADEEHVRTGCLLRSYGWVNGVWDARGEKLTDYVFPLMGITEVEDEDEGGEDAEGDKTSRRPDSQDCMKNRSGGEEHARERIEESEPHGTKRKRGPHGNQEDDDYDGVGSGDDDN